MKDEKTTDQKEMRKRGLHGEQIKDTMKCAWSVSRLQPERGKRKKRAREREKRGREMRQRSPEASTLRLPEREGREDQGKKRKAGMKVSAREG